MKMKLLASLVILAVMYRASADSTNTTKPPVLRYQVGEGCILFEAGIRLHFNYTVGGNVSAGEKNHTFSLDVPADANKTAIGVCGNTTQTLTIKFNSTLLTFAFNRTGKDYKNEALITMSYMFDSTILPDMRSNASQFIAMASNLTQYECPLKKGFICNSNLSIPFNMSTPLVRIETIALRSEAFRTGNSTEFASDYTQCAEDNAISNIIPIAVGAALGALVLVVLIAYLVGRKRNQRGYETV